MATKTFTVFGLLDCEFAIPAEAVVLVAGVVEGQPECLDTTRFSGPDERYMRLDRTFDAESADAAAEMFLESIHEALGNRPVLYPKSQSPAKTTETTAAKAA